MMREPQWRALVLAVMMASLLLPLGAVSANETTEERLAAEGLSLLALRNDTIDTDQDGDIDAVRVVVVLNSTAASNELIVKLRGLHKEREVLESQEVTFQGQTNITVVYDAWSKGEHDLRLDFLDANGEFIASTPFQRSCSPPPFRFLVSNCPSTQERCFKPAKRVKSAAPLLTKRDLATAKPACEPSRGSFQRVGFPQHLGLFFLACRRL